MSMCSTRETPCDFPEVPGRMALVRVQSKSHPTVVCSRVFVLCGGGQCRDQWFHVHNEIFMAQGVKTSTLTKLGSENTHQPQLTMMCVMPTCVFAVFRLCEQMQVICHWFLPAHLWWLPLNLRAGFYHLLGHSSTVRKKHMGIRFCRKIAKFSLMLKP